MRGTGILDTLLALLRAGMILTVEQRISLVTLGVTDYSGPGPSTRRWAGAALNNRTTRCVSSNPAGSPSGYGQR